MTAPAILAQDTLSVEDTSHQISFRHLIRSGYEWMEVTCAPYIVEAHGARRVAMGLTITSSFGAFGFNYPSIAVCGDEDLSTEQVAKTFLAEIKRDELLSKIVEEKEQIFDLQATRRHMEKVVVEVLEEARDRPDEHAALTEAKEGLETLFDELEASSDHPAVQGHLLCESSDFHTIAGDDSWEDLRFTSGGRRMQEAEGLFDKLWVPYQAYLRETSLSDA